MDVERYGWKLHETPPFASGIFQLATFDDTGGSTELIFWMYFGCILDGFWMDFGWILICWGYFGPCE